jgi:hypothetical protein
VIVSHEYGFIFVKTAKTAGTSVELLLSSVGGAADIVTPFAIPEEGHEPRNYRGFFNPLPELIMKRRQRMGARAYGQTFRNFRAKQRYYHHMPAWLIRDRLPREWGEYYTFCVERNPWDKVISGWAWLRASRGWDLSMDGYIELLRQHVARNLPPSGLWPYNLPLYAATDGRSTLVDEVLEFERLGPSLNAICHRLGIPADVTLLPQAKLRPSGVRQVLTLEQVLAVEDIFRAEIALHGYARPH